MNRAPRLQQTFIKIPCQITRVGRKLVYRVLHYNPNLPVFFRLATALLGLIGLRRRK